MEKIQGKNHSVSFDNLFTSPVTAKFLYSKKFVVCCTIHSGRKHLSEKVRKPGKLGRCESITFQSSRLSNLTCTVWKDTKEVRFISTLNWPDIITKCVRVGARRIEVNTPSCAASYAHFYSVVNKYDRHCLHHVSGALGHGSNKVWKHLMFHLTNMAVTNAWILFCETSTQPKPKYYDHMAFRYELATQLIGGFTSCKRSLSIKPIMSGHEFIRMECKRAKRCVAHAKYQPKNRKVKESVYGCYQQACH